MKSSERKKHPLTQKYPLRNKKLFLNHLHEGFERQYTNPESFCFFEFGTRGGSNDEIVKFRRNGTSNLSPVRLDDGMDFISAYSLERTGHAERFSIQNTAASFECHFRLDFLKKSLNWLGIIRKIINNSLSAHGSDIVDVYERFGGQRCQSVLEKIMRYIFFARRIFNIHTAVHFNHRCHVFRERLCGFPADLGNSECKEKPR